MRDAYGLEHGFHGLHGLVLWEHGRGCFFANADFMDWFLI